MLGWLQFVAATAIVGLAAAVFTFRLRLRGLEWLLGSVALAILQIVLLLLLLGLGGLLAPAPVFLATLALGVAAGLAARGSLPGVKAEAAHLLGAFRDALGSWWSAALALLALGAGAWITGAVWLLPPFSWDALAYHLVTVASWIQHGSLLHLPRGENVWSESYPADAELFYTWSVLFLRSDVLVDGSQLPFALLGSLAVAGLARRSGVGRRGSLAAGCLFFLTPVVLVQSKTAYTDVALAAAFLAGLYGTVAFWESPTAPYAALAGSLAGLSAGIKYSGVAYAAVLAGALAAATLAHLQSRRLPARAGVALPGLFLVAGAAFSVYWYARNWVEVGNPFHPFTVSYQGRVLFEGYGTPNELIMLPAMPEVLRPLPPSRRVWASWRHDSLLPRLRALARRDYTATFNLLDTGRRSQSDAHVFYTYDERLGGLGPQWLYLELPAAFLFSGWTLWKRRALFVRVALPLLAAFALQPANWWPRYSLAVVALGAVGLVYLLEHALPPTPGTAVRGAAAGLAALSLLLSLPFGRFRPDHFARAAQLPAARRTYAEILDPAYRWPATLPPGSRIGYTPDVVLTYPLFGPRFENRIVRVDARTPGELLAALAARSAGYLATSCGSDFGRFARNHPELLPPLSVPETVEEERVGAPCAFRVQQPPAASAAAPEPPPRPAP